MHWFLIIKLKKKSHFWPIQGHFWHKNLKTNFYPKEFYNINFKPIYYCNIIQKKIYIYIWVAIFHETKKISFWPLLTQKDLKTKSFPKKSFRSILKLYVAVTSCKKSETFHALIFHQTWKTSFWIHFGPKTTKQSFSQKHLPWIQIFMPR